MRMRELKEIKGVKVNFTIENDFISIDTLIGQEMYDTIKHDLLAKLPEEARKGDVFTVEYCDIITEQLVKNCANAIIREVCDISEYLHVGAAHYHNIELTEEGVTCKITGYGIPLDLDEPVKLDLALEIEEPVVTEEIVNGCYEELRSQFIIEQDVTDAIDGTQNVYVKISVETDDESNITLALGTNADGLLTPDTHEQHKAIMDELSSFHTGDRVLMKVDVPLGSGGSEETAVVIEVLRVTKHKPTVEDIDSALCAIYGTVTVAELMQCIAEERRRYLKYRATIAAKLTNLRDQIGKLDYIDISDDVKEEIIDFANIELDKHEMPVLEVTEPLPMEMRASLRLEWHLAKLSYAAAKPTREQFFAHLTASAKYPLLFKSEDDMIKCSLEQGVDLNEAYRELHIIQSYDNLASQ